MAETLPLSRADADVFIPGGGGITPLAALARTTHLCIAAHQDDIEIMAHSGIAECFGSSSKFFTGVVASNGAGSPRTGQYAGYSDDQMMAVRRKEQRMAAGIGRYNLQLQLGHPSAALKTPRQPDVLADLKLILGSAKPEIVYLHNPADKHDTHIALVLRCLEAIRALPFKQRPAKVIGCEVWRDLDWLVDTDKVPLDASAHSELALPLLQVFDSQVAGGKRYDLAAIGRRAANATFHTSHQTDAMSAIIWGIDLTPLVVNPRLDIRAYVGAYVDRLKQDVDDRLAKFAEVERVVPNALDR